MPLEPMLQMGQVALIPMPIHNDAKDRWHAEEEYLRRQMTFKRRIYYRGAQYDKQNSDLLGLKGSGMKLHHVTGDGSMWPFFWGLSNQKLEEHQRKHAYSSAIQEAVDFLADEMSSAFFCKLKGDSQSVFEATIKASSQLTGDDDDKEPVLDEVIRDALIAGSIAVELVWDPIDDVVRWDCWESEHVDFQYDNNLNIERVIRNQVIWVEDPTADRPPGVPEVWMRVVETCVYELVDRVRDDGSVRRECRKETYINYSEKPDKTDWLGISKIPWQDIRIRSRLRASRGESLITEQAMDSVDRYNANEQLAYIISRYNSHGHLGIVGDQAYVKLTADQQVEGAASVEMDVADVLAFPGGTALQSITLPTNPQMIQEQRSELAEQIYKSFGLARVDPDTMAAFSSVSGYALEILNRRTAGTFRRIKRYFLRDFRSLLNRTLDCHAEWEVGEVDATGPRFFENDPLDVYPDREFEVRMDSGYIVDHIVVRDDFAQQLISRAEALRQLGKTEAEIKKIQDEINEEALMGMPPVQAIPGGTAPGQPSPGPPTQAFGAPGNGKGSQQGTSSGSTVGSVSGPGGE